MAQQPTKKKFIVIAFIESDDGTDKSLGYQVLPEEAFLSRPS